MIQKILIRKYFIFILFCSQILSHAIFAQVLPIHRSIDWQAAGSKYAFDKVLPVADVTNFGAFGDGITNDLAAINNAISSFGGHAGMVFFPSGTYLINGSISLPDSIVLKGSGADSTILKINAGEHSDAIKIQGTTSGNFISVLSGYSKNSYILTLADSNIFSKGDVAEFIQDGHQHMTSSWAMNSLGQIVIIDSVSGFHVYLSEPIRMNFDSLLTPRIRKIIPKKAISIECLKIERLDATSSQTANIGFTYAHNCRIIGIESFMSNFSHINIRQSSNLLIKNSYFHEGHDYGNGGKAYGVCIHATSGSCLVENNIFRKLRHSMLLQSGANGNVFTYNYSTEPYWTGVSLPANSAGDMVLHGNYPYLNLFEGNIGQHIVIDDSHGINGHHNTFFRNRAELYGIFMNNAPATDSVNFIGNEVTNTGLFMGLYFLSGTNHFQYGNNIKGTITPAGTSFLTDISYYYSQLPSFWNSADPFPPIGPQNAINSFSNPARDRFLSGNNLSPCFDTINITRSYTSAHVHKQFELIGYTYCNSNRLLTVSYSFSDVNSETRMTVYNMLGHMIGWVKFKPDNREINIPLSSTIKQPGIYFLKIEQSNIIKTSKLLL